MSDVDELMKEFEISNNTEIWFTDGETWPGMRVNIDEFKAKINRLITDARIDELEQLKEEPLFKRKVVDTEDLRRRTGYVRCRVRVKGLIDSRISELSNNLSKGKDND